MPPPIAARAARSSAVQAAGAGRRRMSAWPRPRKTLTASAAAGKESCGPAADADQSSTSAAESPARAGTPSWKVGCGHPAITAVTLPPSRPAFPAGLRWRAAPGRPPAAIRIMSSPGPGHGSPSAAGVSEVSAHHQFSFRLSSDSFLSSVAVQHGEPRPGRSQGRCPSCAAGSRSAANVSAVGTPGRPADSEIGAVRCWQLAWTIPLVLTHGPGRANHRGPGS